MCSNDIFKPLFAVYDQQTAKSQQSNGQVDAGELFHCCIVGSDCKLHVVQCLASAICRNVHWCCCMA